MKCHVHQALAQKGIPIRMDAKASLQHLAQLTDSVPINFSDDDRSQLKQSANKAVYDAFAAIENLTVSEALKDRCRHAVETVAEMFGHNLRAWGAPARSLASSSIPNAAVTQQRLSAACDHLRMLSDSLPEAPEFPGYTIGFLCDRGGMSNGTFKKIRARAKLPASPHGDTTRRFSVEEVRQLAHAAPLAAPRSGKEAQIAWLELIGETPEE